MFSHKEIRVLVAFSMAYFVFPSLPAIRPIHRERWSPCNRLTSSPERRRAPPNAAPTRLRARSPVGDNQPLGCAQLLRDRGCWGLRTWRAWGTHRWTSVPFKRRVRCHQQRTRSRPNSSSMPDTPSTHDRPLNPATPKRHPEEYAPERLNALASDRCPSAACPLMTARPLVPLTVAAAPIG